MLSNAIILLIFLKELLDEEVSELFSDKVTSAAEELTTTLSKSTSPEPSIGSKSPEPDPEGNYKIKRNQN